LHSDILRGLNRLHTPLSYVFVFLTGATALVYEVVWQRYLTRLTGSDSLATALVLGIFLAGLSGGYALCGWLSRRFAQPGRIYGGLEAIIGFWGIIFPPLFGAVSSATRTWSFASPGWLLLQGSICTVVLIGLPTVCMGGTVPLLTRGLSGSLTGATRVHARLYGTNTAGAFVGVLAAGYLLVPGLGLPGSLRCISVINLLAAIFFAYFSRPVASPEPEAIISENKLSIAAESSPRAFPTWTLYAIAGLNGAAVMTLENVMIRITNLTFGSSSYSFSLLVGVFVLSLACGSFAVGWLRRLPRSLLFGAQTAALASWWLVFVTLDDWPYAAHLLRAAFQSNSLGFWIFQGAMLLVLLAVLIVPVGLLGTTLPLIFHELKQDLRLVGWHSGRMFSANAAGCVVGSVVFGWLLFYPLDNPGVLACALALVALAAALAAWPLGKPARLGALGLLTMTAILSWRRSHFDKSRFAHGTFSLDQLTPFSYRGPRYFYENFERNGKVEFYDDCPEGTVAVIADLGQSDAPAGLSQLLPGLPFPGADSPAPINPPLAIMVNGKPDSNTKYDQQTLKLSAHIPALWAGHRSKALVIGLGTGVTAGELALYPDVKSIDVAELSSGVAAALPLFAPFTHAVQNDPRLHIHLGDAFRVLGRSREHWDLIVSEPSNPWVTGVDMLFSREFYRLASDHLTDDGVLLQWVQKYAIDPRTFGILMNTVRSEFPNCGIYQGEPGDLLVLASKRPLTLADQERAETALRNAPAVQASLAEIGITSFAQLRQRERMGLFIVADQLKNAGVETLDRPRVHYRAGRARFIGTGLEETARDPSAPETIIISSAVFHQTVEMRLQTNTPPPRSNE
jgi:spermidine synthase